MKKVIALLLVLALCLGGCAGAGNAENLMAQVKPNQPSTVETVCTSEFVETDAAVDFAIRLFQNSLDSGENTLVSPLSVMSALAMTANGAEGETLAQMENVLGVSRQELNMWFRDYIAALPNAEGHKMSLANSIWLKDVETLQVQQSFLQTNADYFDAAVYQAPFDQSTAEEINRWVKENTDEMIDGIVDEIPDAAVMYLVNALAFDAKWQDEYKEHQIRDGVFTMEDGTRQDAVYMHSTESQYLEDTQATGFIKYYENRNYAFVALLPNEGVSVEEYVASLTGANLSRMLAAPEEIKVYASIPKFEMEYEVNMNDILIDMGMADAFNASLADFSSLGSCEEGNLFISKVLHKTYISVAEEGTRAGAVTSVEMACGTAAEPEDFRTVNLDRPFVYMLIDCGNNIPFFIGTMMELES